jgi:hypothetical protein
VEGKAKKFGKLLKSDRKSVKNLSYIKKHLYPHKDKGVLKYFAVSI